MEFDEKEFYAVVLGALLHDIGKVVQRAQQDPSLKRHTEWGYEWLKSNLGSHIAINASIAHHYTKDDDYALTSNIGLIWFQSDNLASAERKSIEKERLEEGLWHREVALSSPFSRIRNPNAPQEVPPLTYLPLIQERIPKALTKEPVITKDDYRKLLNDFEYEFNHPDIEKPPSIDYLLMLFEKYFSTVPSITMKIYDGVKKEEIKEKHPDISLYDHSKLAAAIAGCMYHFYTYTYKEKWDRNELLKNEILEIPRDIKPYLLIGGDISGVQKFIYTITSKGALKSLKGRSFYIELLAEHVISTLLNELKLTRCNLIFSGGAHFYVLSHNTKPTIDIITKVKEEIDVFLFDEFRDSLQIQLEYVEFHPDEFRDASLIWHRLSQKIEESKKRKFRNRLQNVLRIETPHDDCLTESCEICFREDLPLNKKIGEDIKVCNSCFTQYQFGEALTGISKGNYPVLYKLSFIPSEKYIRICNKYYQLKTGWDPQLHENAEAVYRVNDYASKHYSHPKSIFLPLGLYQHEGIQELEDLSEVFGIKRIGVLRMDVDNLGKIFSKAILPEDRSFSRLSSISRNLNKFFKYYLNDIVEGKSLEDPCNIVSRNIKDEGRKVSIVYSGGDDLFLIGNWLEIIEVSFDINKSFQEFTGNPYITLSGGISVNHAKYPVYQFAKDAENAEDLAKSSGKNSVNIFKDFTFNWRDIENIINRVKLFSEFLKKNSGKFFIVNEETLPMTFFYRLFSLAKRFNEEGVLILPKAAYLISRMKIRGNVKSEENLKIKEVIMTKNIKEWKITEIATLLTLMLLRKGGE